MIIVPSTLPGMLEPLGLSRIQTENTLKLAGYIIARYSHNELSFYEPLPISVKHFRANLGTHYLPTLTLVRDLGLLDSDDKYYYYPNLEVKGECKKYIFNPDFIYNDPILSKIEKKSIKITGDFQTVETSKLLTNLRIGIDKRKILVTALKTAKEAFKEKGIKVNNEINPGFYKIPGRKTALKLDLIKERAADKNKDVILYGGKCFIENKQVFSTQKVLELQYQYASQITNFKQIGRNRKFVLCRRNDTNNRLTTNLTNLKSSFIPLVTFTGSQLNSIDLSNSQFLIFFNIISNILEYSKNTIHPLPYLPMLVTQFIRDKYKKSKVINCKSDSYKHLEKCVKNGTFYEYLTTKMNAINEGVEWKRADTKTALFQILFSGWRNTSIQKKKLKKVAPELVWLADTFKKAAIQYYKGKGVIGKAGDKKGNNFLPIYLQRVESSIFIDVILKDLLEKGYKVFSKHDSILCKEEDFIPVYDEVRNHLDTIFNVSGYNVKIENKTF
jgi:hypothetical protein